MLDLKKIRENPEEVKAALKRRGVTGAVEEILAQDEKRRSIIAGVEALKAKRNEATKRIPELKKKGEDVSALMAEMKEIADTIKELDDELAAADEKLNGLLLTVPNPPSTLTPDGESDADNVVVRKHLTPRAFDFAPKPHWDIGEGLNILDFKTAASVTGARFTFYRGLGARLERSVINLMLNTHTENGKYTEIIPPYMVHRHSMQGTGQLPKFEEDAFKVAGTDYFLIPTAEVPLTNMYRETILEAEMLPIYHTAYSACFRSEAGSAGRDTRGLIRQHQFNKVELVKLVKPEDSYDELESLTNDAEKILKILELPYRVSALCAGDIGFSSAKTYDIEVWMPSYGRYVEISSCSNCEDFQARRANIKYRPGKGAKPEFVHTLNGSGLAVGRTVAAILENYQNGDGSVNVPEALRCFMGTDVIK
jgi:seryl-tRNA synthetase